MREVRLEFSTFAEPLAVQLDKQGYRFKRDRSEERFQKLLYAWNMLRMHGIQTDSESQKSGKRLMKLILESIEPTEVKKNERD